MRLKQLRPESVEILFTSVESSATQITAAIASLRASDLDAAQLLAVSAVCNESIREELSRCETNVEFMKCDQCDGIDRKMLRVIHRDRFEIALREFIDRYSRHAGAGVEQKDSRSVCIIHEDVVFRLGFLTKLLEAANEIRKSGIRDFGISGYSLFDLAADETLKRGVCYVRYPKSIHLESQCLLLTWGAANELCSFLRQAIESDEDVLLDKIILDFFSNHPLFATVNSLVQHIGQPRLFAAEDHCSPSFHRPWPGVEQDSLFAKCRERAESSMNAARSSADPDSGRGIVICAGGEKYFTCAWVCVRMLRELGCKLPIEFWHLGPEEMTEEMKTLVKPFGVRSVDAHAVRREKPVRILKGFELKCYSILHSSFREVLLLDADNVPVLNPEYLFDAPEYQDNGAIFWPDLGCMSPKKDIWKITGVPYRKEFEFESGQLVVDKRRCWRALNLAMHYNEHSDFYYDHVYGDKETFHFAFRKAGKDYAMPSRGIKQLDGALCQHDFAGKRVFQHRIKKWSLDSNSATPGFLFEKECIEFLDDLKRLWKRNGAFKIVRKASKRSWSENRRIILRTPVGTSTGYELHGLQMFTDLRQLGYKVEIRPTAIVEEFAPISRTVRRWIGPDTNGEKWELLLHPPFYRPLKQKRTVYFTMWEASKLLKRSVALLNRAEAIIVPSQWNTDTFVESGVKRPIYKVPLGIKTDVFSFSEMDMGGACVFGAAGRSDSDETRKGFNDVIPLFLRAFPREKDVRLRVKVFPNCSVAPFDDPRIEIERSYLTEAELAAWFRRLTCFVSMARGEGWGLMQHQALA